MKTTQLSLILVLLSPLAAEAAALKFSGALDSYNSAASTAPFTLTVSFNPATAGRRKYHRQYHRSAWWH